MNFVDFFVWFFFLLVSELFCLDFFNISTRLSSMQKPGQVYDCVLFNNTAAVKAGNLTFSNEWGRNLCLRS